jgi:branched-subunit amino acid aminotransferase/4-amino-4-deoxychorismate lyase
VEAIAEAYVEIDGQEPSLGALRSLALDHYGHFTAMQVRGGGVRGLDVHLRRLAAQSRELFGEELDTEHVRALVRQALRGAEDASARVIVFRPADAAAASIMLVIRPPREMSPAPQALLSVDHQRPLAHVKHIGGFGQAHYRRVAARAGYDDALLTGPGGVVSEAGVCNVAFVSAGELVWPDAPSLHGATMQLLEPRLAAAGIVSRHGPVRLLDVPSFEAGFATNARGIAPIGRVDDVELPVDEVLFQRLLDVLESVPFDRL